MKKRIIFLILFIMITVGLIAQPSKQTWKPLKVGDKAPLFDLMNEEMQWVKLSEDTGKEPIILTFYLFDFSGGCQTQMDDFNNFQKEFKDRGVKIYGISVDSPFCHKAWKKSNPIEFPLLSDFNKEVSKLYGAYYEKVDHFKGVSKRAVFIIGKDGLIKYAWVGSDYKQLPSIKPVKEVLDKLTGKK